MIRKYYVTFDQLRVGSIFSNNGNKYFKRSTRTAEIVKPEQYAGHWWYFGMSEYVIITDLTGLV